MYMVKLMGSASAWMSGRTSVSERQRATLRFACSTWGSRCLSDKRGRGRRLRFRTHRRMDALPAPGGGHTEMMQQKARRRNATPDLFFETSEYNSCNIRLKPDETLEKPPENT